MKVISIVNTKGGTGKSTIATNIATALAMEGKQVMLVDTDKKQESSMDFAAIRSENEALAEIGSVVITEKTLFKTIKKFANMDYVVIDAGAGDNELVRNAMSCSYYGVLIIPVQPSQNDIAGTYKLTFDLVDDIRSRMDGFEENIYVVFNRIPANRKMKILNESLETMEHLCRENDIKIMQSSLTDRVAFKESICVGMNVIEYEKVKGNSNYKASDELRALVNEIKAILGEEAIRNDEYTTEE